LRRGGDGSACSSRTLVHSGESETEQKHVVHSIYLTTVTCNSAVQSSYSQINRLFVPLLKFYYNPLFSVHWLNERIYLILTYLILLLKHKISLSLNVASINISVHVDCCSHLAACTQSLYVVTRLHSQQSRLQDINILRSKINSSPIRIILSLESTSWFISLGTKAPFAPSASRRRDHIWPTCKIVMYAYSSSCQIHHCQLRVYDGISTGVVW